MGDKRIMCVGLCCVDIISVCASYPVEDSDQRSLEYYWQRGGNASNSTTALALLGENVEFMGTLIKGPECGFLEKDLTSLDIKMDHCVYYEGDTYKCPVATVIINKQTGSRTIIFSGCDAELKFEDFDERINLQSYKWIHFEGRPRVDDIKKMVLKIGEYNSMVSEHDKIQVSLELEKPKAKILVDLIQYVDVAFVSKEFASSLGYATKEEAVEKLVNKCKQGGAIVCAWGEDGAAGKCGSCDTVTSPIFPPEKLVDTLAAGDTFNAGTVYALARGKNLHEAITFGCKVAGAKCGMTGKNGLKGFQKYL